MKKLPLTRRVTLSIFLKNAPSKKLVALLAAISMMTATRSEAAPDASTRAVKATETFAVPVQKTSPTVPRNSPKKPTDAAETASQNGAAHVVKKPTAATAVSGKAAPLNAAAKVVAEKAAPTASKNTAPTATKKSAAPSAPAAKKAATKTGASSGKKAVLKPVVTATKKIAPTASVAPTKVAAKIAPATAPKKVAPIASAAPTKVAPKSAASAKATAPKPTAKNAIAPAAKAAPRVLARPAGAGETAQTFTFENGAQLLTRPDRAAPLVVISLVVRAGAGDENAANAGWRRLLCEAMLRASSVETLDEKLRVLAKDGFVSGTQMQKRADELGGRIGASVGDDAIELWASGPSENASQLADLLFAVALHPRLNQSDLAAARDLLQVRGDDALDDPSSIATTALRTQLYRDAQGKATAYALPVYGTDASLASLSRESLQGLHARYFVPSRLLLSVAGDVNAAPLKERLAALPPQVSAPMAAPVLAPMKQEPPLVVKQVPSALAWVFISYRVANASSDDLPALRVLAAALGEARGARLPNRLLGGEKTSASGPAKVSPATAQQVSISFTPRRYGTELIALAQVDTARIESVKNAMLQEIGKVRDAPLSAQELTRARNYVLGSFATDREGLHERAYLAALATSYAAPTSAASTRSGLADAKFASRVANMKSADVQRVARKYLTSYAVALLMPSN